MHRFTHNAMNAVIYPRMARTPEYDTQLPANTGELRYDVPGIDYVLLTQTRPLRSSRNPTAR